MFQEWFFDWLYQRPQMTPSHFEQCHVNIGLKETVPEELDKVKKMTCQSVGLQVPWGLKKP